MPPKGSSKRGKRPQQAQTDSSSPSEDQLPLRKTSRKEATTPLQRYHDGDLKDDGTSEDELGHASEEETIRTAVKPAPSPRVIINVASGDTANELETDNLTAAEKPSIKVMQQPTKGMKRARFSPTKYSADGTASELVDEGDRIDYLDVPVSSTENGQKISSPLKPSTSATDLQQLAEGQSDEQQTVEVPSAPPVLSRKAKLAMVRAMIEDLEKDEDALALAEVQAAQAKAAELEAQLALLKAAAQKVSEAMVWCTRAHPSGGEEMHALREVLEAME